MFAVLTTMPSLVSLRKSSTRDRAVGFDQAAQNVHEFDFVVFVDGVGAENVANANEILHGDATVGIRRGRSLSPMRFSTSSISLLASWSILSTRALT